MCQTHFENTVTVQTVTHSMKLQKPGVLFTRLKVCLCHLLPRQYTVQHLSQLYSQLSGFKIFFRCSASSYVNAAYYGSVYFMYFFMFDEIIHLNESLSTVTTLVRLFTCVCFLMFQEIRTTLEPPPTCSTQVRLFISMNYLVSLEGTNSAKPLATCWAFEKGHATVLDLMVSQFWFVPASFSTRFTGKWKFPSWIHWCLLRQ